MSVGGRRRACATCSAPLVHPPVGRPRTYCSAGCRQSAYERRRRRRPRNDWHTPPEVRQVVLSRWPIALDAAACSVSALVPAYLGPDHNDPARRDALAFEHWADLAADGVVYLNPPYLPSAVLGRFLAGRLRPPGPAHQSSGWCPRPPGRAGGGTTSWRPAPRSSSYAAGWPLQGRTPAQVNVRRGLPPSLNGVAQVASVRRDPGGRHPRGDAQPRGRLPGGQLPPHRQG